MRSTEEVCEQCRARGSGVDGGKAPGQGETARHGTLRAQHRVGVSPAPARSRCATAWVAQTPNGATVSPETGPRCGQAARRDLRGGLAARPVPTATAEFILGPRPRVRALRGPRINSARTRGLAMTALVLCNEFLIHHTDRELLSSRHRRGEPEPAPRTPPDRWSNRGPGRCAATSSPTTLTTKPHASTASNRRNGRSASAIPGQLSAVRLPAGDPRARPSSLGVPDRGALLAADPRDRISRAAPPGSVTARWKPNAEQFLGGLRHLGIERARFQTDPVR